MSRMSVSDCTDLVELSRLDYIDSRDVEELMEELVDDVVEEECGDGSIEEFVVENSFRLELEALRDEINSSEWQYGLQLIRESEFTDYCEEMLKDCGDLPRDIPSYIEIDWEKTAQNLSVDYSEVEINGVTFLYRD